MCPPATSGFEPPDIPSPLAAVLGLFQEGVAMSTAPSMPASVSGYLLPACAHSLLSEVGEVLRRLAARAAVEQASDDLAQQLLNQPGVLSQALHRLSARIDVALQQCVAAPSATRRQSEAP
nr:hypothetical protein [Xanthomonas vasicola]